MDYEKFTEEFLKLTEINLSLYKSKQMNRRINTYIERKGLTDFDAFFNLISANKRELELFKDYITIHVTEFFRTPDEWNYFEENAVQNLIGKSDNPLKIWSCACSSGEEPYSLAISFVSRTDTFNFKILATDINEKVLNQAKKGIYSTVSLKNVSDDLKQKYFTITDRGCIINKDIKDTLEFKQLNLLKDEFPEGLDLIVCRNVLIYFTDEAKDRIYSQFFESLKPGGFLFTGNTEQLVYYKNFGYKRISKFLYEKPGEN